MAKIYYEQDADLNALKGKTLAVIGYGNQGLSAFQGFHPSEK